jgi:hypothetical protein
VNGLRVYQHYLALKKHYTNDKYDVFTSPRVPVPEGTFAKRNDRKLWDAFAARFAKAPDVMDYMVANFAYGNPSFFWDSESGDANHAIWKGNKQKITYLFEGDLNTIRSFVEKCSGEVDVINFDGSTPPHLLNLFLGKKISLESMVILNSGLGYIDQWKGQFSTLPFFTDEIRRIDKSQRFIKFNKDHVKSELESFKEDLKLSV